MSNFKFILSNYVKPEFIKTNDSSCNCSLIDDKTLLTCWRNFTFINFKYRKKYQHIIGRHIWFNDTLWSDSKLYDFESLSPIKFLTKTDNHKLVSSGCEDFRIIKWNGKNYALYSKIMQPFAVYDEHFCEIDENLNIKNDITFKTKNKIEKNWQPIEDMPFTCVYSYKPFTLINLSNKQFIFKQNNFDLNYRGSTQVINYKDKKICIVHLRNETENYHYYTHYFVVFDKNMNLLKITKPFSFTGAEIEFCTYMKNNNNTVEILMSVNDQLSFKFNLTEDILDSIIDEKLDNNVIQTDLYDNLYKFAKLNNNIITAICLATYTKNKDIIEEAIMLNHSCQLLQTKKEILQKILLEIYYDFK